MPIFDIEPIEEKEYTDSEREFLRNYNLELKNYSNPNKDLHIVFHIKIFWCLEKNLLIIPLIFHPLNYYWAKTGEENPQRSNLKERFKKILEWEFDSSKPSYLNTEEIERVVKVFREL